MFGEMGASIILASQEILFKNNILLPNQRVI